MRVMRLKISFLLQLILCCILAVGCATKKYYYPHREIDRGVNAPEGARNLAAGGAMLLREGYHEYDIANLFFPLISYGVTDRLCYPAYPFPVLQYAFVNQTEIVADEVRLKGLSVAVMGGCTGLSYSAYRGLMIPYAAGILTKLKLGEMVWLGWNTVGNSAVLYRAIEIDGTAAGGIGVSPLTDIYRKNGEMGYWLGEAFRNRGVMTRAVTAIVREAFSALPIDRIFAVPFSNNPASHRVLEKSGFVLEGQSENMIIKNGILHDQLVYAVRRDAKSH